MLEQTANCRQQQTQTYEYSIAIAYVTCQSSDNDGSCAANDRRAAVFTKRLTNHVPRIFGYDLYFNNQSRYYWLAVRLSLIL